MRHRRRLCAVYLVMTGFLVGCDGSPSVKGPTPAGERPRPQPAGVFINSVGMSFKVLPEWPDGAFSIGVHEVTQSQYQAVMGNNPSGFKLADSPVEQVSWDVAAAFCAKLSAFPAEVAAGQEYRLPTEAEWDYACRAGTTTTYSFGDDEKDLGKYAWFSDNSDSRTHRVGRKLPNAWGLYDMHGNVWEWCADQQGLYRQSRGGGWGNTARSCRSAFRYGIVSSFRSDFLGFRVALSSRPAPSPDVVK